MLETSPTTGEARTSAFGSFFQYLVAGVVALNLVVAAIGWFSLKRSRAQYDERAVINGQNISKILDENLKGIFAKVDIAMLAVVDEAERQLASGAIQDAALNAFIVREHTRLPELLAFRATDAAGDARYGPRVKPVNTTSLAHRDYFKHLRETPEAGLVISKPLIGGISGKWMIILARRINRPDGGFAGLVYSGLALDYLTKDFARLDIGRRGSIALIDQELAIVARYPDDPARGNLVGQKVDSKILSSFIQAQRTEGTYLKPSGLDAVERTFSFRKLGVSHPYYLLVGLATTDYRSAWRSEAWQMALFMAIFIGLSTTSAVFVHREWRRNEREVAERRLAQERLTVQNGKLEATLARTKRLEGLISICMHCKKINNKQASWEQIEKYISDNSDALFSHGICPDCYQIHYPGMKKS